MALEYFISIALGIAISYFYGFHIWLACKGMTTAEYNSEYKRAQNNPRSDYDVSCFANLKEAFGDSIIEWVLPMSNSINRYEEKWRI